MERRRLLEESGFGAREASGEPLFSVLGVLDRPQMPNPDWNAVFSLDLPRRPTKAGFQSGKGWPEGRNAIECGSELG
jgi:hypothetical protein